MNMIAGQRIPVTIVDMTDGVEGPYVDDGSGPALIAGQCRSCRTTTFPRMTGCPRCRSVEIDEVLRGPQGILWSFTVQRIAPKSPPFAPSSEEFKPYGVGYVELGDIIVESRLTTNDPTLLRIGLPMTLTTTPFATTQQGVARRTFAFCPSAEVK